MFALTHLLGGYQKMIMRITFTITAILLAGMMSGCCCGPIDSCGGGGCGVGGGYGGVVSPFNGLAQVRKAFICGSGCGESYTDEWCSTPPDACDPCSGGTFVGGATPCVGQCWYPGKGLLGFAGSVASCAGHKFCQFCNCLASHCTCGAYGGGGCCGGGGCSGGGCSGGGCGSVASSGCGGRSCNSGGCGNNVYSGGGFNTGGQIISGGGGCSTCSSNNVSNGNRIANHATHVTHSAPPQPPVANRPVANPRTARSNAVRRGVSQADSYHTRNTLYR